VDIITTGNHIWDRDETENNLSEQPQVIRPINFPPGNPGIGSTVFETERGGKIAIINAQGRIFMKPLDCPFRVTLEEAERLREQTPIIFVDFHAEATSEKKAMGYHLDGKVSAVIGTHTHIQTADETILPGGTAYINDAGMTGPHYSIIGVRPEQALKFMLTGRRVKFSPAENDVRLQGVFLIIDDDTGKAEKIERIDMSLKKSKEQ